jgi:hypothetical protein
VETIIASAIAVLGTLLGSGLTLAFHYRRCLVHLWFCEHEQLPHEDPSVVRVRAYDLRSNVQEALFRVQMLTDENALSEAAEAVLADVTALP